MKILMKNTLMCFLVSNLTLNFDSILIVYNIEEENMT